MGQFLENHLTLISVLMIVGAIVIMLKDYVCYHFMRPKYKTDDEGFLMYKHPYYNYWAYVTGWDDKDSERTVTIHDTIRGIVFDYHYTGPGRYKIKVPESQFKQMKYKDTKELHKEQRMFIDREDALLKKILKENNVLRYE